MNPYSANGQIVAMVHSVLVRTFKGQVYKKIEDIRDGIIYTKDGRKFKVTLEEIDGGK